MYITFIYIYIYYSDVQHDPIADILYKFNNQKILVADRVKMSRMMQLYWSSSHRIMRLLTCYWEWPLTSRISRNSLLTLVPWSPMRVCLYIYHTLPSYGQFMGGHCISIWGGVIVSVHGVIVSVHGVILSVNGVIVSVPGVIVSVPGVIV